MFAGCICLINILKKVIKQILCGCFFPKRKAFICDKWHSFHLNSAGFKTIYVCFNAIVGKLIDITSYNAIQMRKIGFSESKMYNTPQTNKAIAFFLLIKTQS